MKKKLFMSGLLFAMVMCFMMSFTAAGAWDCEEKGHSWSKQAKQRSWNMLGYEQYNDEYHYELHKCVYCDAVEKEQKEHRLDYSKIEYEQYNEDCHYVVRKCKECEAVIKKQNPHYWSNNNQGYKQDDNDYHYMLFECENCKEVKKEQKKHSWSIDKYEQCNEDYHDVVYKCYTCSAEKKEKKSHKWDRNYEECIQEASINQTGLIEKKCKNCKTKIQEEFSWSYNGDYCVSYDGIEHSLVYKNSTSVTVKLKRPVKGGVLRVTIGGKNYDTKLNEDSKKIKVKIKKPKTGSKIKMVQLFKGEVIGQPSNIDYDNYVYYAKKIKKGMTKKQVKYLYDWGRPSSSASTSGGWYYWYYDDGSFVAFKKGKVKAWYNAAG